MTTNTLEAHEYREYTLHIEAGKSHTQALAAVRKGSQSTQEPRRATEGAQAEESPIAQETDAHRAEKRRRTPQRDAMPEGAGISPLNEKQFTQMVVYAFRSENWLCYHTFDSRRSEPGFPDIVAVHAEYGVVFAELKMPRGVVSEHQEAWLDRLRTAGQRAYLWRPNDWAVITAVTQGQQA